MIICERIHIDRASLNAKTHAEWFCDQAFASLASDLAASAGALGGDMEELHLKLLSLLDNPAAVVAAAAQGDVSTIKDYLSKHPQDVC